MNSYASAVLMVRPCRFGYNTQTAATNIFQKDLLLSGLEMQRLALKEFDGLVSLLENSKITVEVFEDTHEPLTPDSIFPNNWFSTHDDGSVILYPMLHQNRRNERRNDIVEFLKRKYLFHRVADFSSFEKENKILEGTGSLIFDRKNKIAFANLSSRTNKEMAEHVCSFLNYSLKIFEAGDINGDEIYHTNVIMTLGAGFGIICLDAIKGSAEKKNLSTLIKNSGREIVDISREQMHSFCGNALQLNNKKGENILVMSDLAYSSFKKDQVETLEKYSEIIHSPISTIEKAGGGSARCMMAEIFSPKKNRS